MKVIAIKLPRRTIPWWWILFGCWNTDYFWHMHADTMVSSMILSISRWQIWIINLIIKFKFRNHLLNFSCTPSCRCMRMNRRIWSVSRRCLPSIIHLVFVYCWIFNNISNRVRSNLQKLSETTIHNSILINFRVELKSI